MSIEGEPPLLLVLVGTDHHRFDRLVRWVVRWAASHPGSARVVVQHGTSDPARGVESYDYLAHDELTAMLLEASVVVCHGGPTTIAETRRRGLVPIVVPRDPALGEHVDGHQQRFTRRLAAEGLVCLADDESTFRDVVRRALEGQEACAEVGDERVAATCASFSTAVGLLLQQPRPGGRALERVLHVARRLPWRTPTSGPDDSPRRTRVRARLGQQE